jgi:hypothetical protein
METGSSHPLLRTSKAANTMEDELGESMHSLLKDLRTDLMALSEDLRIYAEHLRCMGERDCERAEEPSPDSEVQASALR